jgi:TP901 family phage tail tape measure protein
MAKNTQTANILLTMDGKQAEKWLEILAKKSETLRDDIRSLNKQRITIGLTGEEAKKFDALKKEYRDTHRQTRELAKQLADVSGVINKLSTTPIKAIKDAIKAVTAQMERLDRGTEKYAQRQKQLKVLREELDRISSSGKKNVGVFDQIGATIKRLAAYVLVYAGFNKLTEGLRKMYDMNVALSDQLSDIEKTTGITGRSLSELSDDINRIDTRTPVEELNKLAVAAGKIGIQGKEDVLEFVKAGNIINVALGEDLGEDAIKNIAKLNDVLGITKELGVEKSLLATGSAINELGQNSTASEGYLVDFAQRLGGIAAQAGLTVQQVLALGSASDQMGQNVEVSATALNKMITTIVSKTGQVAKAIGVTKDELQGMLDKSTWDALLFVFEKLSGKGGLAAIAPLMGDLGSDGARLTQVISALASNTDKLNREIGISNKAFAEATSVVNEYDKKNNNLAGTIEKIGKNIQRWFLGSKFVDWMLDVAKVIEDITGYTNDANIRFKDQSKVVKNLISNTNPLIEEYKRLQDSKTEESQQRLKDVILEIQKAIPGAVSEFDQYGNAIKISTDRAEAFIRVQKIQLQQMNKEAIKSTQTDLDRANFQLKQLEAKQKEIEKRGTYTIQNAPTFGGYVTYRDASSKEVENVTRKYMEQRKEIKSLEAVIHELKGDYIEEMLIAERVQQLKKKMEGARKERSGRFSRIRGGT